MHRFRKKSDAKRAHVPENLLIDHPPPQSNSEEDPTLQLPPVTDFRTSLILPSLSRRFTLLRNTNGDPISLDNVRSRFAEQRAKGEEIQITEEEEDIIVQALKDIQATTMTQTMSPILSATAVSPSSGDDSAFAAQGENNIIHSSPNKTGEHANSVKGGISHGLPSSPTSSSHLTSLGSSRSPPRNPNKRYSNNLFGSGRFHDPSYFQTVSKTSVESRSTASLTGSDSQGGSVRSTRSLKDTECNNQPDTIADVSGEGANGLPGKGRLRPAVSPSAAQVSTSRLPNEFTPQQMGRTTLALQQVIRSMEEDVEETIVVPRSRPPTGQSTKPAEQPSAGTPTSWIEKRPVDDRDLEDAPSPQGHVLSSTSTMAQPSSQAIAYSPTPSPAPYSRQDTTSPAPRIPGYIPGMTRPLTPRAIDSDREGETNGYSTTPRARSPAHPTVPQLPSYVTTNSFSSRHHHQPSVASVSSIEVPIQTILPPSILRTTTPRGPSPGIPLRTTSPAPSRSRGNSTTNAQILSPLPSPTPDDRFKSDFMMRRSMSPFAPGAVTGYTGSRPATPSTGPWRPSSPYSQSQSRGANLAPRETNSPGPELGRHSRNGSLVSSESHMDTLQRNNTNVYAPFSSWMSNMNATHPDTSITSVDLGQPLNTSPTATNRLANRVPTPVSSRVRPHDRSVALNDTAVGQDPILLNRPIYKKVPKRIQTTTPPPHNNHIQVQIQTQTPTQTQTEVTAPVALHTPSTSSNSSSNANLNIYGSASPMFSPLLNTSATSLLSIGSSYHSWADDDGKKTGWDQLVEYDSQRSPWQEILNSHDQHGSETDDSSDVEPNENPEEVLHRTAGLSRSDLVALHKRLVEDAMNKRMFDPPRSPIRRRRMSNSRVSFSAAHVRENGATSPPPRQPTPVANQSPPSTKESNSRANALLDSVLHSIQNGNQSHSQPQPILPPPSQLDSQPQLLPIHSPEAVSSSHGLAPAHMPTSVPALTNLVSPPLSHTSSTLTASDAPTAEPPSTTDDDYSSRLPSISSGRESREDDASARYKALVDAITVHEEHTKTESRISHDDLSPTSPVSPPPAQSHEEDSGEATEVPPSRSWRSPQAIVTPTNHVQLVRDVSRRTAEATAALKSRTQVTMDNDGTIRRKTKAPINVQHISNPQLISSSTASLEAMPSVSSPTQPSPVASPVDRPTSKLTDRFRKFRGSLRSKPQHSDTTLSSVSSPTTSLHSPLSIQRPQATAQPSRPSVHSPQRSVPSVTIGRSTSIKAPTPNAVAPSTTPKKSILDIFRKPKKDAPKEFPRPPFVENPSYSNDIGLRAVSRNASQVRPSYTVSPSASRPRPSGEVERDPISSRHSEDYPLVEDSRAASPHDLNTMKQFLSAASRLGIDPQVVNEVLARSGSVSSKQQHPPRTQAMIPNYANSSSNDPLSALSSRGDNNIERSKTPDATFNNKPATLRPHPVNRYPEGEVVRRTLVFANENISVSDLNNLLLRKDSIPPERQSRSASAASFHSTGSIAPREAREPPVPRLPVNLPTNMPQRTHASKPSESSSFFDAVYGQDGYVDGSSTIPFTSTTTQPEEPGGHGPALEVLELSNGQMVWSVLSSLRAEDEDDQSFFRRSMASSRGHDGNDDMEIRVKEHKRNVSQGSYNNNNSNNNNSNNSRRRVPAPNGPRPETKVFRTNASTIGRLIDDLSKNMDSGTINFHRTMGATPPIAQSSATSFHSETSGRQVERDIDALLNALGPRQGSS